MAITDIGILIEKADNNRKMAISAQERQCFEVSASRYYYAALQIMKYIVLKLDPSFEVPDNKGAHDAIFKGLKQEVLNSNKYSLDLKERGYFSDFHSLKDFRNRADYEPERIDVDLFYNEFFGKYKPFYSVIDKIKRETGDD